MKKILLLLVAAVGGSVAWGQCLPTYNSQCTSGDYINSVDFNTISNTGTGCGNPSTNNYTDYTAISTNLQQNTSYPITVTPGPTWGQYFVAYIDFNNDLDFDDANEFFDIGYVAGGGTLTGNILIPSGIPGGSVTMRVMCQYGTGGTLYAGDACSTGNSFGEVEDYTVNISSPLTDDAGIASFVSPTLPTCNFTDSVRVELFNYGTDPLTSATINFSINAGVPSTTNWTGSLAPFTSEVVNLGLFPLASGDNLVAISSMPNGVAEDPAGAWNDFADIASLQAGLAGTYTIGGTTPDYADFTSAVADISTFGLCGNVVFDVRDGVYNENIDLTGVISDSLNTLTFQSENADATLVTLSYAPTGTADNFVVKMTNTDYVSFLDLTMENTGASYGRVLDITGGSDHNHFENCHFHTTSSSSTSTNYAILYSNNSRDNWNSFINNTFEGGSYAVYWYGAGTAAADLEEGTVFDGNTFLDNYYYGARFERQDAPVFTSNSFIGESTYTGSRFAMYLNYCDNGFTATDNVIAGTVTSGWTYGIYALNNDGTAGSHAKMSNNMVQVGKQGSTSTFYGIYLSNSGYIDIEHNTAFISEGGTSSRAFYGTSGGGNTITNNMFVNYTAGYAIYLASNYTVLNADYNLYHSPSGNLGYFANANQATLADWQTAFGGDANSVDMDPSFHSTYDLHVCNDLAGGLGTPIAAITSDIDGQVRDAAAPDMGADEFSSLSGNFLGADQELCTGEMITLSAGSPSDMILWSTGDTTTSITVSAAGTYSVDINSVCGAGADTIIVTASADVYTDFLVADTLEFCTGGSALLYSNAAYDTYAWTGGTSNDSLTVTAGGNYTLDVTDACGSGTQTVTVTENDVPVAAYTWTNSYVTGMFTNTSTSAGSGATYAWDFGDGVGTSSDENPSYVYSAAGTYTVTLTVTNACGTNTYTEEITVTTVGIEEIEGLGTIAVYPNPSNGIFQLDVNFNQSAVLELVVVNMLGEEVSIKQINAANGIHSGVIDLTNSAPGVYFLKVISDNNTISTQVLVKK